MRMNYWKYILGALLICLISSHQVNGQDAVTIGGKHYYIHKVESKETLYSIAKKYNVGQKDLINANPQVLGGDRIKNGDEIRIPIAQSIISRPQHQVQVSSEDFIIHSVKKGETAYSISKLYGVSINDLCKWNPGIDKELKENDRVRIKSHINTPEEQNPSDTEDKNYYYHTVRAGENPSALARRYNVKVQDLFIENPIIMDNLKVGAQIKVPKNTGNKEIKTKGYFWHQIEAGDTYYAYQRLFGTTKDEILELNNELHDNLPVGVKIKIPTAHLTASQKADKNLIKYDEHEVQKGETIWGLSQKYKIEIDELKEINPELKTRNVILGEILLVPRESKSSSSVPSLYQASEPFGDEDAQLRSWKEGSDTFKIALFLPLYLDKNFSEVEEKEEEKESASSAEDQSDDEDESAEVFTHFRSVYKPSRSFLCFYEGFLLGLNDMQAKGIKTKLRIMDTQSAPFTSGHWNKDLDHADLIVGPVDIQTQKPVADFAAHNHVPMLSPLSTSDSLTHINRFYCQVAASRKYIMQRTADYIGEKYYNKNIVVIDASGNIDPDELNMVSMAHERVKSMAAKHGHSESFKHVDFSGGVAEIHKALKENEENIVLIPAPSTRSTREVTMSKVINALQVLAGKYHIVIVGYSDYLRLKSINAEYYHRLNFTYLASSFVEYDDLAVNKFISNYRNEFEAEPNQFSFRGYDLAVYFCEAYSKYGRNYFGNLDDFSTDLLQIDLGFKRLNGNGYINQILQVIQYLPDYSVKVVSKY